MIRDRHDDRLFRHYAKLDANGSVTAIVEVAAGSDQPPTDSGDFLEVTAIHPYDAQKLAAFVNATANPAVKKRIGK
jgi:hypothetical protein